MENSRANIYRGIIRDLAVALRDRSAALAFWMVYWLFLFKMHFEARVNERGGMLNLFSDLFFYGWHSKVAGPVCHQLRQLVRSNHFLQYL
jgi:hypothetical protein